MKRPASVTAALVVLSLLSLAALYWVVIAVSRGRSLLIAIHVVELAAIAAPVFGLWTRRNWARIYTCVLFAIVAVLIFVGNAAIAVQNNNIVALVIYGGIISGLLGWNIVGLMSKETKQYFAAA